MIDRHDNHDTCITPTRGQPWPENRPATRLAEITAECLALTYGEPPTLGGPYARFDRRCLAEYLQMTAGCESV